MASHPDFPGTISHRDFEGWTVWIQVAMWTVISVGFIMMMVVVMLNWT